MRLVALLLIGLFIGALGAVAGMSALRQDTPYNRALMTVLRQQMGGLNAMREAKRCDVAEATRRIGIMHAVSHDTDAAFLPVGDDELFRRHSEAMQSRLAQALASPPSDCAALAATVSGIGGTCKACHDDFR
jgi:cytochrome c556